MNAEVIGTWAGQVWNALNESGKLTVKGLKKATKLKEKELYAALGWLAETSVGNIGLCSLNCATGCASPLAATSSVRICCTEYIMWEV